MQKKGASTWRCAAFKRSYSIPTSDDYSEWTVMQLKEEARFRHLKNYSKRNKNDLITALQDTENPPHISSKWEYRLTETKLSKGNPNLLPEEKFMLVIKSILWLIIKLWDLVEANPPPNCPKEYRAGKWRRSISMHILHWKCKWCDLWLALPLKLNYRCLHEHKRRCKGRRWQSFLRMIMFLIFLTGLIFLSF